jgi:redox-sensitive bicupin YhaK (pirin superfamily)
VLFSEGGSIAVSAAPDKDLRFIFFSGKPLYEEIAWGGPIVMNTRDELNHAFNELNNGTFIKH